MNYQLVISLDGADKTEASLDSILAKVGKLSSGSAIDFSMDKAIDEMEKSGEKGGEGIGESIAEGVKKGAKKLMSFNILDAWGKSVFKSIRDSNKFWDDAITHGSKNKPEMQGPDLSGKLREAQNLKQDAHVFAYKHFLKEVQSLSPQMQGPDLSGDMRANALEKIQRQRAEQVSGMGDISQFSKQKVDWKKILTGVGLGFSNPYIGSRLISDEMGKHEKSNGIVAGIFGKGGIAGFSEIFAAFKIFNFAVKSFKYGADKIYESSERAKQLYAKSLQSGLGVGFTSNRMIAAKILGVSETEVLRFGAALNYLNPKIKWAATVFENTNPIMTQLSWQTDILKENFAALVAKIGSDVAPTLIQLTNSISEFVKKLAEHAHQIAGFVGGIPNAEEKRNNSNASFLDYNGSIMNKVAVALGKDKYDPNIDYDEVLQRAMKLKPGGLGVLSKAAGLSGQETEILKRFVNENKKPLGGDAKEKIPGIQSSMQKLSASSWEKMGLVVGQGGNSTNELIKKSNGYLKSIAEMMKGNAQQGNNRFGLNPQICNP